MSNEKTAVEEMRKLPRARNANTNISYTRES